MDQPQNITWYEDGPYQDTFYTHWRMDIIGAPYIDIHIFYALRSVRGQLRTSSHQLDIEVDIYT